MKRPSAFTIDTDAMPEFVLAPMDGMTHASFRVICFRYGAEGATTEMIQSLAYGRAKRKLSDAFLETLVRFLEERNLAAQLIGSDPGMMAASARKLEALQRFDAIDINMGCPARKVVGSGNGSALLKDVKAAKAVMRAVRESVDMPVRLKLRLGWDSEHIVAPELIREAQALGFESVTLHGRTREQHYRGTVDVQAIRNICQENDIPVYANGGVTCARDAIAFLDATGAQGVAIGRAALKQPWIFDDIRRLRAGEAIPERGAEERIALLKELARLSCGHRPEVVAIREMRKFSLWLLEGLAGFQTVLDNMNAVETLEDYERLMDGYLERLTAMGDTRVHPGMESMPVLDTVRVPGRRLSD